LDELVNEGRAAVGEKGTIVVPTERRGSADEIVGTYRHNKKGFGFVIPTDVGSHEDVFVPEGNNAPTAITGDVVRVKVTGRGMRDGKPSASGKIIEVIERKNKRFVGTLQKSGMQWFVLPDGNTFTEAIYTPDAATKYITPGTTVVVEITEFPTANEAAMGVITEVLGKGGEKDVDLKTVIVTHSLPGEFPDEVKDQASAATSNFDLAAASRGRYDMTNELICTIDPDDAKDYDDAISLWRTEDGLWEVGVHIADVSYFVKDGTPLDIEARARGNSTYFPGHVIPMLPEILSNGICSLQEGVPRLTKSAFITFDEDAKPIRTRFSNSVIKSRKRLRYREAQAIIDRADVVPHPHGDKKVSDYEPEVIQILDDMNTLSRAIQKRRHAAGQLVLNLPRMELVLDENGKVIDAVEEDHSFTHTLIEMFMVEANEAVARLLDAVDVPFLRRTHPEPEAKSADRLRSFLTAAGHVIPKDIDRHVLQGLLAKVKDKPEAFSVNLAVLRSLTRAEYSPKIIGHFALASVHYCHFTSPIRRYADLTIHRLMDAFFAATEADHTNGPIARGKAKPQLQGIPTFDEAANLGKQISYTERRSEDAERELRQVKLLELMTKHIGEQFLAVVSGITNFGLFLQIQKYLVEGLVRYPELLNDRWEVDEKAGTVRGQKTGQRIRIGDVCKVTIRNVDLPRRELGLVVNEFLSRGTGLGEGEAKRVDKIQKRHEKGQTLPSRPKEPKLATGGLAGGNATRPRHPLDRRERPEGETVRNQRSKQRDRKKRDD
ncbi:MAG TPA: VacB/RNase II family 3'-5' exoribonuclease, partial [Tepidisphaeraceae bacterium]